MAMDELWCFWCGEPIDPMAESMVTEEWVPAMSSSITSATKLAVAPLDMRRKGKR